MKSLFLLFFALFCIFSHSQSNTEIYLFDLKIDDKTISINNPTNISNNEGYDNQPSFLNDNKILFASTRNGQTDIAQYQINYNSKIYINSTEGGEYTPLKIPNKNKVSAVRLDKDGKQRLYSYNLSNGQSTELIKDLVVAYYTWFNEDLIVSAVIEDDKLNLFVSNIKNGTNRKYANNVGRSFHKIPNSKLVSFISKENENQWQIKSLDPYTGATKVLANTMRGVEDICWLDGNTILSGKETTLYKFRLNQDNDWKAITDLSKKGITNITRIAANSDSTKLLAAVDIAIQNTSPQTETILIEETTTQPIFELSEEQAAQVVQKHIEPFNNRQLDDFANAFDENVSVNRFPNTELYAGRNILKKNYETFFKKNKKSQVRVLNRMILKNTVIDEELVTLNNTTNRQVTIYETDTKGIKSMTFINNAKSTSNPESIVNKQLEAYNAKDIDVFASTYTSDIKLYAFPNTISTQEQDALRKQYDTFFKSVPDLNVEIVNRIVLGNKVIDKEKVRINGEIFYAIAIYEIENGLISKVTFIQ